VPLPQRATTELPVQGQQTQQAQVQQSAAANARIQSADFAGRAAQSVPPPAAPPPPAPPSPDPVLARFITTLRSIDTLSWRTATAQDTINAFGIDGATNTQIEIGRAPDNGAVVRVRQRLQDGRDIVLLQWDPQQTLARQEREQLRVDGNSLRDSRMLADGSHQVIVRTADAQVLVAIRVAGADPLPFTQRLVRLR
jgi:hypothetical protein